MNPSEIERITNILPCLSTVSHHDWHHAELVSVNPSTPHTIQEGRMLQHAMFMVKGSVRIHKISEQGREITLYRVQGGQSCVKFKQLGGTREEIREAVFVATTTRAGAILSHATHALVAYDTTITPQDDTQQITPRINGSTRVFLLALFLTA